MSEMLKSDQHKKLVKVLSKSIFTVVYEKEYIIYSENKKAIGLFSPSKKQIILSDKSKNKDATYLHEIFHLCFYNMDKRSQKKMLASIKNAMREIDIKEKAEEVLAEHFALYISRKALKEDYKLEEDGYCVKEVKNLPKRIDKIFQKILKSIQKTLKEYNHDKVKN